MLNLYKYIEELFVSCGYTVEMFLAVSVFACYLEKKKHFILRAGASYCMILICYVILYPLLFGKNEWKELLFYLMINVAIYQVLGVCFHTSAWSKLFVLIGADTTQHIAFRIYSAILGFLGMGYEGIGSAVLNTCMILTVYMTVFWIFRKQLHEIDEYAYNSRANIILGGAVFIIAFLIYRFEEKYDFMRTDPKINFLFTAYAVMANIFLLALLYGVFNRRKMTGEMEMLEEVIDRQKAQYELMKETIDMVNIKCHDMKQQISMYENRIDRDALQEIKSIIHVYDTAFKTENEVLDVFLQEKLLRCEQEQIKMDCIVEGRSVNFIRPADLYTLVGNAIDNAMEAVRKIKEPEKRLISLSIRESMNMVLIHVDNAYVGALEMVDGLPKSTKGDDLNHGFGMRSMGMIAEKYNGTLSVALKDGIFHMNILIPVPKKGISA